jgi:type IV pilus assembly protein PilA
MLSSLIQRLGERRAAEFEAEGSAEAGFTLIELMVVLLILAILLAIAIPTFLGVTGSANDRAAQSNLNTALTNAKTVYEQSNQAYPTTVATLAASIMSNEPSLPMTTALNVTAGQVGAVTDTAFNTNGAILFSLAKKTNECWWVADNTATMGATPGPAAAVPWNSAATALAPAAQLATKTGVPETQGIFYGVYKEGAVEGTITNGATCDTTTLGTASSIVSTTAFPSGE